MIEQRVRTANDNAGVEAERPVVTITKDCPDDAYARCGNLLLPLRFARRMPGWRRAEPGPGSHSDGGGR